MNRLVYTTRTEVSDQEKREMQSYKGRQADSERLKALSKRQSLSAFLRKYDR